MHDRDLPGRAAEAQRRDPQPDAKGFADRDADEPAAPGRHGGTRRESRSCQALFLLVGQLCVSLGGVAAPAIERIVERHPGFELLEIVGIHARQAERRREQAGRFGRRDRGGRYRRRARSPRAARARASARPNSSIITSKVQGSPRWLQNTPSMSNGAPPNCSATPSTSDGATNRNSAAGSTKRRISHGQAMRSIFGRARVTQTVRPCGSRGGSLACRHERQAALRPGVEAAVENFGGSPGVAQPGRNALAELQALRQMTTTDRPRNSAAQSAALSGERRTEPGMSRGSARKVVVRAHIDERGAFRRADQASEFFEAMLLMEDMMRPCRKSGTRYFGMSPRGEIAFPMPPIQSERAALSRPRGRHNTEIEIFRKIRQARKSMASSMHSPFDRIGERAEGPASVHRPRLVGRCVTSGQEAHRNRAASPASVQSPH